MQDSQSVKEIAEEHHQFHTVICVPLTAYMIEVLDSSIFIVSNISPCNCRLHWVDWCLTECVRKRVLEQSSKIRIFETDFHVVNDFLEFNLC
jgi:hypothetical protein